MQSEIKRWGNSAAVRIPSKILAQANLDVSSPISIEVKAGKIVIGADVNTKRKVNLPFSEAFCWKDWMHIAPMLMSLLNLQLLSWGLDGAVHTRS